MWFYHHFGCCVPQREKQRIHLIANAHPETAQTGSAPCAGTCSEFTLALTICRRMNSDQSPSHARCSASLHKSLAPSLGDTPHNSIVVLATMTLNLQSLKFALWCLAVGITKLNRHRARSVRRASRSFTVCSCSWGHGAPYHHHFAYVEQWHSAVYGGKQL